MVELLCSCWVLARGDREPPRAFSCAFLGCPTSTIGSLAGGIRAADSDTRPTSAPPLVCLDGLKPFGGPLCHKRIVAIGQCPQEIARAGVFRWVKLAMKRSALVVVAGRRPSLIGFGFRRCFH
jgi:hypothetical protein